MIAKRSTFVGSAPALRGGARMLAICVLFALACSQPPAADQPPATKAAPAAAPAPTQPSAAAPAPAPAPPTANNDEACGQIILVAYAGAAHAKPEIKRTKAEAKKRAGELLAKLASSGDFAALAKTESDAPSSAPRGGIMGTFAKTDWPELHRAIRDPLFALPVGEIAPQPIEADYGFVILRRCPVEKAHAAHILIRYKGAKNAKDVTRDKAAALKRAMEISAKLKYGGDFAALAKSDSEDASAVRGGDIGSIGRGLLSLPFEEALFTLKPGERSDVIETEFGYHIIERLPD